MRDYRAVDPLKNTNAVDIIGWKYLKQVAKVIFTGDLPSTQVYSLLWCMMLQQLVNLLSSSSQIDQVVRAWEVKPCARLRRKSHLTGFELALVGIKKMESL